MHITINEKASTTSLRAMGAGQPTCFRRDCNLRHNTYTLAGLVKGALRQQA